MVHGWAAPGFEAVREEFERNFESAGSWAPRCAAYVEGEQVVDLWGGVRTPATTRPGSATRS